MVLFIFFPLVLLRLVFRWNPDALAWLGLVCLFLAIWLRNMVAVDLCGREGFRGGPLLDIHGSLQLLNSCHVRERDKALGVSGMVFFLDGFEARLFHVGFVGARW